jgi:hypothetical protein
MDETGFSMPVPPENVDLLISKPGIVCYTN